MANLPVLVGLHLTKCAGTSLITTVRRSIPDDSYCFFSSFYENLMASRGLFSDIADFDRLEFVFGHYVHEYFLRVFANRPVLLFTGLREPVGRAVSHFGQINTVRALAGQALLPAEEYLASSANSLCGEILRGFPGARALVEGPLWRQACAALSLFDYVYSTRGFNEDVKFLLNKLTISHDRLVQDNVFSEKVLPPDAAAFIAAGAKLIRSAPPEQFGDDTTLYNTLRPHLGVRNFRALVAQEDWALNREAFVDSLPEKLAALAAYRELEMNYLVYEFESLGKIDLLRSITENGVATRQHILQRIETAGG